MKGNVNMSLENLKIKSIDDLEKYNLVIIDNLEPSVTNNIDTVLKEKHLTPSNLSKMSGIGRQNLNEILKGKMKPNIGFALRIAKTLNKPVEEIFKLTDDAWIKTTFDDNTLFIDMKTLKITSDKKVRKNTEYIMLETNELISKEKYEELLNEYIENNYSNVLEKIRIDYPNEAKKKQERMAKDELIYNFSKVCTNRYKKIGERLIPLVNKN